MFDIPLLRRLYAKLNPSESPPDGHPVSRCWWAWTLWNLTRKQNSLSSVLRNSLSYTQCVLVMLSLSDSKCAKYLGIQFDSRWWWSRMWQRFISLLFPMQRSGATWPVDRQNKLSMRLSPVNLTLRLLCSFDKGLVGRIPMLTDDCFKCWVWEWFLDR